MSGRTILNYVIAAIVAVVVIYFTAGLGYGAYASLMGGLAFSGTALALNYYNGPKGMSGGQQALNKASGNSVKDATAADLEIAAASEAVVCQVVFGMVKLVGNFLRYDTSTFRTKPIIQKYEVTPPVVVVNQASGGKGGGGGGDSASTSGSAGNEADKQYKEQVVGYDYYLSFDYGLCMGPVDRINRVWDTSDQRVARAAVGVFGASQSIVTYLSANGSQGPVRVYKGSSTQTRAAGEVYTDGVSNYRNVCFANFQDFYLGANTPQPRSFAFEVVRWPVCLDATGLAVDGLLVQGSLTSAGSCWFDANPAACLYEIFTNKVWGRGLDPDLLDAPSFVAASNYFATQNIGMSFSLDSQSDISDVVDLIRMHVSTVVVWDGSVLKCKCMLDTANTFAIVAQMTSETVNSPEVTRPTWPSTVNELRVSFTNRTNNYKTEMATCQMDAAINTCGLINSSQLTLNGFTNRALAESQATRILGEMCYPTATLTVKMNRWDSRLEPGDLVEFVWLEWGPGPITTYWRVVDITDNEQSADGIKVTLREEMLATPYEGEPVAFVPVVPPFQIDTPNDEDNTNLGEDHTLDFDPGTVAPLGAWEMNAFLSGGNPAFIVTGRQGSGLLTGLMHYWSTSVDYTYLGATVGFAIPGTLSAGVPANGRIICRAVADWFTLALADSDDEAAILSAANKVTLDADNLQVLPEDGVDLLLIGREIIMVGLIEELSAGAFTVKNYLRGCFGTPIQAHASGSTFAFIPAWSRAAYQQTSRTMPFGVPINMRTHAVTTQGENFTNLDWHGPESSGFLGLGVKPFTPGLLSAAAAGLAWTVVLRPRWHSVGAMCEPDIQTDLNALVTAIPDGYSWQVQSLVSGVPTGAVVSLPGVMTPDDGTTPTAGVVTLTWTAPAGTTGLRVWSALYGVPSLDPLTL